MVHTASQSQSGNRKGDNLFGAYLESFPRPLDTVQFTFFAITPYPELAIRTTARAVISIIYIYVQTEEILQIPWPVRIDDVEVTAWRQLEKGR